MATPRPRFLRPGNGGGGGGDAYVSTGANRNVATDFLPDYPPSMIPAASATSRTQAFPQQGYSSQDPGNYYGASSNFHQPKDVFYGRGNQAGAYNNGNSTSTSNPASDDDSISCRHATSTRVL